jgi:endo-1,4-beta-xylanase
MNIWDPNSTIGKTISCILAILLVVLFLLCVLGSALNESCRESVPALRDHGFLIGTAVDTSLLLSDSLYTETLSREFNMVEAENSMKWATIHPARDTYDFREGDKLVDFAAARGMKVRGHCLLWGAYLPHWLGAPEIRADLGTAVRNHIHTVAGHYRGRVFAWDVVNEAFDDDGNLKPTFWFNRPGMNVGPGTAYIEKSFVWAHEADPSAKLFYNEFGAEELNAKSDAVFAMVKDFKRRGIPVDGVGLQAHLSIATGLDLESFKKNMARFAELGVEIHITELDVAIPRGSWFGYRKQAALYQSVMSACLAQPKCTAVQIWGFTDRHSWIPSFTNGLAGDALPFDKQYEPKPAYQSLGHTLAASAIRVLP